MADKSAILNFVVNIFEGVRRLVLTTMYNKFKEDMRKYRLL